MKNITEQLSIIEQQRLVDAETLKKYLPDYNIEKLPALYKNADEKSFSSEREILYKILFDMKNDINNLKKLVHEIIDKGADVDRIQKDNKQLMQVLHENTGKYIEGEDMEKNHEKAHRTEAPPIEDTEEYVEESLSLQDKEIELIKKALDKHQGKRKYAAQDLGISERTLYRKIKEYDLE